MIVVKEHNEPFGWSIVSRCVKHILNVGSQIMEIGVNKQPNLI